jgi:transcriptional regulator
LSGQGKTTIELTKETRDQLKALGKKGETYEEIIKRLLKQAKQTPQTTK